MRCKLIYMLVVGLMFTCSTAYAAEEAAGAEGRTPVPQEIPDEEITAAIEQELFYDGAVSSHLIDVNTKNGIVTLSGVVDNMLARQRAAALAEVFRGVRSVVNRVTVQPVERSDKAVLQDVRQALADDAASETAEIEVAVNKAVVRLNGVVDSRVEMEAAEQAVKGVSGVRDVENEVKVRMTKARPDAEIERDVNRRMQLDERVNGTTVFAEVQNGEVHLHGSVASAVQKRLVAEAAQVAGVKAVNAEDVSIRGWGGVQRRTRAAEGGVSDDEIAKAVKEAFIYDPRVSIVGPEVRVRDRRVTLRGTARDLKAKRAAEAVAERTIGVRRVKNLLRVRPEKVEPDKTLTTRVQQAVERDPYVTPDQVDLRLRLGKVYLSGSVDSRFAREHIEEVIAGLRGVIAVENNLKVEMKPAGKQDQALLDEIETRLFWNPYVDEENLAVAVEDGVATLRGTVDNWFAARTAVQLAEAAGAEQVRNKLRIRGETESY